MQCSWLGPAVENSDSNQDVLWCFLGVFDKHVEIAIIIENARVDQLIFEVVASAPAIGTHQEVVGIRLLWIFVEVLHVRVRGRAVQVEVIFLDVLAVIPFVVRQSKKAFFEDRIFAVPQRQGKAKILSIIGDAREAVFSPTVSARSRLVMSKIIPSIAI